MADLQRGESRCRDIPLQYVRLTAPQRAFCSMTERFILWRGGNSIGKSWGNAFDTVHELRGTHPLRLVRRPPVNLLIMGYSWAQMDPLCEKLWAMLPKDEIDPRVRYEPGQGFRGFKEPVIPFVRGPGRGSVLGFATYEQGAGRIQGAQKHGVRLDEPPPESVYSEALPRLNRFGGSMRITMTPTPESPPLIYLEKQVERGLFKELQTSLTVAAVTPLGGIVEAPWMSARRIAETLDAYLADERPMREHGAWRGHLTGRVLEAILGEHEVDGPLPGGNWILAIGIDHGAKAGRQVATLVACAEDGSEIWILDEATAETVTSISEDAANILLMLERNNLRWSDIDIWRGDRRHGGDFFGNEKSNTDLTRALAELLGVSQRELTARGLRIKTPHKQLGSVRRGYRIVNSLAKDNRLRILRRCSRFLQGAKEWTGKPEDPLKDGLDSARYAIEALVDGKHLAVTEAAGRFM